MDYHHQISVKMTKIIDITNYLESIAPLTYQEGYDNSGLITGNPMIEVKGILITLDVIEDVVEEAIAKNCNLIVAHHPIIFKGLKKLTGRNYVERTIIKAIKNDIAIYAAHTNLDNVSNGVNAKIAEKIGLQHSKILAPKLGSLQKLVTFVPKENAEKVAEAVYQAGGGKMGNYEECSFSVEGTGSFMPLPDATPFLGKQMVREQVIEMRLEFLVPINLQKKVINALIDVHPYETVAYYLQDLQNSNPTIGAGMIGYLKAPMNAADFLSHLKESMDLNCIRHTDLIKQTIQKVAVCGGAGSFLLSNAINQSADVYISADFKYHEFFEADSQIIIMDIGHYESEVFTKDLFYDFINKKFTNIAVNFTEKVTNPITYY